MKLKLSELIEQQLLIVDRRVKRLNLTNANDIMPNLDIAANTYNDWRKSGFKRLSVRSLIKLLKYIELEEEKERHEFEKSKVLEITQR
jgi:hypothetical protein